MSLFILGITDEQLAAARADVAGHAEIADACFWGWWPQPHYAEDANTTVLVECIEAEQRQRAAIAAAPEDEKVDTEEWWTRRLTGELEGSMRRIHEERDRCEHLDFRLPDWARRAA